MVIEKLKIKNFKSIGDLEIDCRRVNVFIGEPNIGKSNILEVIGLLSHVVYGSISDFVRMESLLDLFYYKNVSRIIEIRFDNGNLVV